MRMLCILKIGARVSLSLRFLRRRKGGGGIKTPQNWSDHLLIKKRLKHGIRIHVAKVSKEISP